MEQNINLCEDMFKGDEADQAFGDIYIAEQQALQKTINNAKPENQPNYKDFDGENCVDCGEEMIAARLKHKFIRCVHCQEKLEKKQKIYGKELF